MLQWLPSILTIATLLWSHLRTNPVSLVSTSKSQSILIVSAPSCFKSYLGGTVMLFIWTPEQTERDQARNVCFIRCNIEIRKNKQEEKLKKKTFNYTENLVLKENFFILSFFVFNFIVSLSCLLIIPDEWANSWNDVVYIDFHPFDAWHLLWTAST